MSRFILRPTHSTPHVFNLSCVARAAISRVLLCLRKSPEKLPSIRLPKDKPTNSKKWAQTGNGERSTN